MYLPILNSRFWTEMSPDLQILQNWSTLATWSESMLPIYEWEDLLYIAVSDPKIIPPSLLHNPRLVFLQSEKVHLQAQWQKSQTPAAVTLAAPEPDPVYEALPNLDSTSPEISEMPTQVHAAPEPFQGLPEFETTAFASPVEPEQASRPELAQEPTSEPTPEQIPEPFPEPATVMAKVPAANAPTPPATSEMSLEEMMRASADLPEENSEQKKEAHAVEDDDMAMPQGLSTDAAAPATSPSVILQKVDPPPPPPASPLQPITPAATPAAAAAPKPQLPKAGLPPSIPNKPAATPPKTAPAVAAKSEPANQPPSVKIPASVPAQAPAPPVAEPPSVSLPKAPAPAAAATAAAPAKAKAPEGDPFVAFFDQLNAHFSRSMLMLKHDKVGQPWKWNAGFQKGPAIKPVDLLERSPFSLVLQTHKPYHGALAPNPVVAQFAKEWNKGQNFQNLTVVPLMINEDLLGFLLAEADGEAIDFARLKFAEQVAEQIIKTLKERPTLLVS